MNSFQDADAYPATLAGQLLKLCNETPPGEPRQRMARTLTRLFEDFENDPANNNPTGVSEYYTSYYTNNCQWFKMPSR